MSTSSWSHKGLQDQHVVEPTWMLIDSRMTLLPGRDERARQAEATMIVLDGDPRLVLPDSSAPVSSRHPEVRPGEDHL